MAQLPPKIPNMTPNWPDFSSHHKMLSLASLSPINAATNVAATAAGGHQNPSWVDEFLNLSSVPTRGSLEDEGTHFSFPQAQMKEYVHHVLY
ncbi:hypothetical protein K1719_010381 [Acacia pycnantha]|nr:hypothetical protein K1719_010381 [Acacia pycnantha]